MLSQQATSEPQASLKWQLVVAPRCCGLPTASPSSLMAEVALRFSGVNFDSREVSKSMPLLTILGLSNKQPLPSLQVQQSKRPEENVSSVQEILELLKRNNKDLSANLTDGQIALMKLSELACVDHLFPLLTFLLLANQDHFKAQYTLKLQALTKQSFFGGFNPEAERKQALHFLKEKHNVDASNMEAVSKKVLDILQSLERLYIENGASSLNTSKMQGLKYFLGTNVPSYADCFVYACVSILVHANFGTDGKITNLQRDVRLKCPLLLAYVETLRTHLFDSYAGMYELRAIPDKSESADDKDIYTPGRVRTVICTVLFAAGYFIVANAGTIAAILMALSQPDPNAPPPVKKNQQMLQKMEDMQIKQEEEKEAEKKGEAGENATPSEEPGVLTATLESESNPEESSA